MELLNKARKLLSVRLTSKAPLFDHQGNAWFDKRALICIQVSSFMMYPIKEELPVCFVTFRVVEVDILASKVATFCLKCIPGIFHILRSNLLHYGLMLHFASYFVTFCVEMFTICVATQLNLKVKRDDTFYT